MSCLGLGGRNYWRRIGGLGGLRFRQGKIWIIRGIVEYILFQEEISLLRNDLISIQLAGNSILDKEI